MKTTLTDSQITVINLPEFWNGSPFDVSSEIKWIFMVSRKKDFIETGIYIDSVNIFLLNKYKDKIHKFTITDFRRIIKDVKPDRKGIIRIDSLEINFEKKQITIS